jgi:hypothetical protein
MSELQRRLDGEAQQVQAESRALDDVLHRAERRRRVRRIVTGAVALAVAGGSLGLAYAAFRPGADTHPAGRPVPGPTPTEATTSDPLPIEIIGDTHAQAYLLARLAGEGSAIREGGYDVVLRGNGTHQPAHTLINCPAEFDHEAQILQQALFPTASIGPALPDEDVALRITLGRDFEEQDDGGLTALEFTQAFMAVRVLPDDQAHRYLSDNAADQYHRGEGGLELFGYADGGYRVTALSSREAGGFVTVVQIFDGSSGLVREETLAVGDDDPQDGRLEILSAALIEGPAPAPAPTPDQVAAFVEGFLQARHDRSGAGTYLGEDARAAYAAHEQGLDLLGYAAGPGPVPARIVQYDKLSPDQHQVVVRFGALRPGASAVYETLLIGRLGDDGFVVLDVERGRLD